MAARLAAAAGAAQVLAERELRAGALERPLGGRVEGEGLGEQRRGGVAVLGQEGLPVPGCRAGPRGPARLGPRGERLQRGPRAAGLAEARGRLDAVERVPELEPPA